MNTRREVIEARATGTDGKANGMDRLAKPMPPQSLPDGSPTAAAAFDAQMPEMPEVLAKIGGGSVVASLVAHGGQNGANPFGMVHNGSPTSGKARFSPSSGKPTETPYTSGPNASVHHGALGQTERQRKVLNNSLLGAIGAVG